MTIDWSQFAPPPPALTLHQQWQLTQANGSATTEAAKPDLAEVAGRYAKVDWAEAWKGQPSGVDWLLEPMIERGTVNSMFAIPGVGKSLITLEAALRLVRAGYSVVYLDEENRLTDLVERLQAFGAAPPELAKLNMYSFARLPPLDTADGGQHLEALAVTNEADLVVLDTTSRMVQGGENDSDTFLNLYRHSLVPLKQRGITTLRLDHPGKDINRGQRGSSAKNGDVDTIWRLEQVTQVNFRLMREKSRSGHGVEAIQLTRRFEPLRHDWDSGGNCPEVLIADKLGRLGLDINAGRPTVRRALADAGVSVSNDLLTKAIKYRKELSGQLADSDGQPDS